MSGSPFRLCLVTDRGLAGHQPLAAIVAAATRGGVTMVQWRDKTAPTRASVAEAMAIRDALRAAGVPLIVNDRVDVALAVRADGIHVGQDDMDIDTVRRIVGPDMLLGLSITCEADMARADALAADYLGIGPLFAQATKADAAPPLGLDGLSRLAARTRKPVLAIGGIGATNAGAVMRAGADGLAVVSAIMAAPDPQAATRELRDIVDRELGLRRG